MSLILLQNFLRLKYASQRCHWLVIFLVLTLTVTRAKAEELPNLDTDDVDRAVAKALEFLRTKQQADGAITQGSYRTAMTSLSLLAMAATGNQPTDPTEIGGTMKRAIDYLLKPNVQGADGYYGADGGRMYTHGITTLALSEMLGMGVNDEQDKQLRERCQKAIDLIIASQRVPKITGQAGGWRYEPRAGDSDLSVTVWQVMALRSARNAGLAVPADSVEQAVGFIRRCFFSARDAQGRPTVTVSGLGYQPGHSATFAMSSAGLLSLHVCGQRDLPEVRATTDWLNQNRGKVDTHWFMYGMYYFAQGMYQSGGPVGDEAQVWVRKTLLPLQNGDGSWQAVNGTERDPGPIYGTCMAVLSLAVKYHFLPIYQR